jgi:hypothetical protein
MAYLRFELIRSRLRVSVVAGHKVNGRVVQERVGELGRITTAEPISASERGRFWEQLPQRFAQIEAKFPKRISRADRAKFESMISARIARPAKAEERKALPQDDARRQAPASLLRSVRGA